jgi:hypothetical protein
VTPEQFNLMVNLSASFLLFALFIVLVANAVFFYYLGLGLRSARRDMPGFLAEVDAKLGEVEAATYEKSSAALAGPIRALSAWQGLKTGTRVLLGRGGAPRVSAGRERAIGSGATPDPSRTLEQGAPPAV